MEILTYNIDLGMIIRGGLTKSDSLTELTYDLYLINATHSYS